MDDFLNASGAGASSYLCWQADGPVGKTALLADYVRHPPPDTDILNFFVSGAHGTDTRAEFEKEMAEQTAELLGIWPSPAPVGVREWRARFAEVAMREGGKPRLLLVVDGLDDDIAWSDTTIGGRHRASAGQGSIAALLPLAPVSGTRVIVSLRRGGRFPDDVPNGHPLRRPDIRRPLAAVGGLPRAQRAPSRSTPLGRKVRGLLAAAGGGLRIADLAELTSSPCETLERLMQGAEGRSFVVEDPVFRTYALVDPCTDIGEAEVARRSRELLTWSERWRAAGWPEETPPFPLAHQGRLLPSRDERDAYLLDPRRLRRLASTAGQAAALSQLDAVEAETVADGNPPAALELRVLLAAARAVLSAETRDVPFGAPALLVRLGEEERARALARSAPSAAARAAHVADLAVEASYARKDSADALAREAAWWLSRTEDGHPDDVHPAETHARLLAAARTLVGKAATGPARSLIRAVLRDRAAGVEALTGAAGMLAAVEDSDALDVLRERAENLSEGGARAQAAAVELWGELARAVPSCGPDLGNRIEELCAALDCSDGLAAVDVLAVAASALTRLSAARPRAAQELAWRARDWITDAVADPTALPEEDQAHLGRELAGTLARFVQAMEAVEPAREHLDEALRLLDSLPEDLRTGVLGDDIRDRARWLVEDAQGRREPDDENAKAARSEAVSAKRREEALKRKASDACSQKRRKNEAVERTRRAVQAELGALDVNRRERARRRLRDAEREAGEAECRAEKAKCEAAEAERVAGVAEQEARAVARVRSVRPGLGATGTKKRPRKSEDCKHASEHRVSAGLAVVQEGQPSPHVRLLHEADEQLGANDLPRSRELVEAALRDSPALPSASRLSADWTVPLAQALGRVREYDEGEALAAGQSDVGGRVRHWAALSLGCSFGGNPDAAGHYAQEAARLVPDDAEPRLGNVVAQALAYAGSGSEALARVAGNRAERRQGETAVAAGLAPRCPAEAARIVERLVQPLTNRTRIGESLPELAALLLAFPDVRRPDVRLQESLRLAAVQVAKSWGDRNSLSMVVLRLLLRLGCLSEDEAFASAVEQGRSAEPAWEACAERALLSAVDGDTTGLWRHVETAWSADARAAVLSAAAASLVGIPVALATDSRAVDRGVRTCLALVRASRGGDPPVAALAAEVVEELLRTDAWVRTVPLLPELAPQAPARLSRLVRAASQT